jgi:hypothetical protein
MTWKFSVLVIANVTAASDELLDTLRRRAESGACEFTLLVPATGGGRAGREAARAALESALERLRADGLEATGTVGDPDPVAAAHDVWDPRRFDEIVVATLPTGASRWLAVDLPHRLERLTGAPVLHVVAQPAAVPPRTEPAPEHEHYGVLAPLAAALTPRR